MKMKQNLMAVLALFWSFVFAPLALAEATEEGKKIAFNRKKGNCLACHMIAGGDLAGTLGPPLVNMKDRFPDRAVLRDQIWDSTAKNPNSMMPPFGKHSILSDAEIDKVVDFIHQL